jgi:hypothetical protein
MELFHTRCSVFCKKDEMAQEAKRVEGWWASDEGRSYLVRLAQWAASTNPGMHFDAAGYLLATLAKDELSAVRDQARWSLKMLAKYHGRAAPAEIDESRLTLLSLLETLAKGGNEFVRRILAEKSDTPATVLEMLAKDEDVDVRMKIAENSNTPTAALETLAKDEDVDVRKKIAENSNTPTAALEMLARDENVRIRAEVALFRDIPVGALARLTKDEDAHVRACAIRNENTPAEMRNALAKDSDATVRFYAAWKTQTPEVLAELAKDEDRNVRCEVVNNKHTPSATLAALARDRDSRVRGTVARNSSVLELLAELARDEDEEVCSEITQNEHAPPVLLELLAKDAKGRVRQGIASRTQDPALLSALARDEDPGVRREVAKNGNTPAAILEALKDDANEHVCWALAVNTRAPGAVLARLAMHASSWVRESVAKNPTAPAEALTQLAGDADTYIRLCVARNTRSPSSALEILARDADARVWQSVLKNEAISKALAKTLHERFTRELARIERPAMLEEIQRIKPSLRTLAGHRWRNKLREDIERLTYARLTGKPADQCLDTNRLPRVVYDFTRINPFESFRSPREILIVLPGRHEVPFSLLDYNYAPVFVIGLPDAGGRKPTLILRDDTPFGEGETAPEVCCLELGGLDGRAFHFANLELDASTPTLIDRGGGFGNYLHEVECTVNVEFCDINGEQNLLYAQRDWALALQEKPEWEGMWKEAWRFAGMRRKYRNCENNWLDIKCQDIGHSGFFDEWSRKQYQDFEDEVDRVLAEHDVDLSDDDEVVVIKPVLFSIL